MDDPLGEIIKNRMIVNWKDAVILPERPGMYWIFMDSNSDPIRLTRFNAEDQTFTDFFGAVHDSSKILAWGEVVFPPKPVRTWV